MNVNEKIAELETQLSIIQLELNTLKSYVHSNEGTDRANLSETEPLPERRDTRILSEPVKRTPAPAPIRNVNADSYQRTHQDGNDNNQKKSSSNMENLFGKYFMGVAASILIFIALILFGILIYRNFTDTLKMITIYGISTVLLVSGCLLLHRKRNAFFLSLTGCGLGAFYTSLIITYAYFHRISDIALYVMLLLWAALVILIARQYHAVVISVIGQTGILIASIFGMSSISSEADFLLMSVFMLVSTSLFLLLQKNVGKQALQYFLILSDAILLCIVGIYRIPIGDALPSLYDNLGNILLLIYSTLLFFYFVYSLLGNETDSVIIFSVSTFFLIIATIEFALTLNVFSINSLEKEAFFLLIWFFLWWIGAVFLKIEENARLLTFIMLFTPMILIELLLIPSLKDSIQLSLFFVPMLLYGTLKKDTVYRVSAFAMIGLQLLVFLDFDEDYLISGIITGITLILAGFILVYNKANYDIRYKLTHYFYVILYIMIICHMINCNGYLEYMPEATFPVAAFTAASVTTIAMLFLGWCKNPATGEEEPLMYSVLSKAVQLFLAFGIGLCYWEDISIPTHFLMVLWLTVLCLYGCKRFVQKKGMQAASVILAVKYTLYILLILYSFTVHVRAVTSILCLVIAIFCILLGFRLNAKYLRIYGLVLTMLAIAKLLLIDISYSDAISRIVSFFVCGVLCFLINFIYSMAVKKRDGEDET